MKKSNARSGCLMARSSRGGSTVPSGSRFGHWISSSLTAHTGLRGGSYTFHISFRASFKRRGSFWGSLSHHNAMCPCCPSSGSRTVYSNSKQPGSAHVIAFAALGVLSATEPVGQRGTILQKAHLVSPSRKTE